MEIIFLLLPLSLLLAFAAIVAYVWASRSGQFDDLETPAQRMLFDDQEND
jgi:cbb3-type cytochrome oxidase maturation protein